MSTFKLEGKFLGASPIKQVGINSTLVRQFWLDCTTNADYPNTPEFSLIGDKCALVENIDKGTRVLVSFNINGRKWEKDGKKGVNVSLTGYKLEKIVLESAAIPQAAMAQINSTDGDDDLPF